MFITKRVKENYQKHTLMSKKNIKQIWRRRREGGRIYVLVSIKCYLYSYYTTGNMKVKERTKMKI